MGKKYIRIKGHYRKSRTTYVKPHRASGGERIKGYYRKSTSTFVRPHLRRASRRRDR